MRLLCNLHKAPAEAFDLTSKWSGPAPLALPKYIIE
jgi:hypothetical protein